METKTDGFIAFAGGMYLSGGNHHAIGEDQAEVLVNATVRYGFAESRPAFHWVPVAWDHRLAQRAFESGAFQGAGRYDSDVGPRILYAFDGRLLSFDPVERLMRMLSPAGVNRPFHRDAPFVHIQQRGRWAIAQDGVNKPVIVEGDSARLNEDPYNGIPAGVMMADGWHRLVVVSPCRTRIYISDHEYDPATTPLSFTDDATYFKNARYFEIPRQLGRVVGVHFAPSFNFQDDLGPLLVFCERGTRAYRIQYPREQWLDLDIAATMLPTTGACSHGSIVSRENDVLFSDHEGRIQTFRAAISRRDSVRIDMIDQPVHRLYDKENASLRRWRRAAKFDDRVLTTIWPERIRLDSGRTSVRHRGIMVLEERHMSDRPFVWAGLWTGVYPVSLETVGVYPGANQSPQDRCYVVSLEENGRHALYELTREHGPDLTPEPRRPGMWIVPRWMSWENIFARKNFKSGTARFGRISGPLEIQAWWETGRESPEKWFTHRESRGNCLTMMPNCSILRPDDSGHEHFGLSSPPRVDSFYRARPWLRFAGDVQVQECVFAAELNESKKRHDIRCEASRVDAVSPDDCRPNFWEPHVSRSPADPIIPSQPCS